MKKSKDDCGCDGGREQEPASSRHPRDNASGDEVPFEITVEPFGPSDEELARAAEALLVHPSVRAVADHDDVRLLAFRVDADAADPCSRSGRKPVGEIPSTFAATIYDYAENHVLDVTGPLEALDSEVAGDVQIQVFADQPLPSDEEFDAAVEVVRHDRELRERLKSGAIAIFRPMPPVFTEPSPDGRTERTLTVGLRSTDLENTWQEIVGVRMFVTWIPSWSTLQAAVIASACPSSQVWRTSVGVR